MHCANSGDGYRWVCDGCLDSVCGGFVAYRVSGLSGPAVDVWGCGYGYILPLMRGEGEEGNGMAIATDYEVLHVH